MTDSFEHVEIARDANGDTESSSSSVSPTSNLNFEANLGFWTDLRLAINSLAMIKFTHQIDQQKNFNKIASLKPRLINETLQDCINKASPIPLDSKETEAIDGCDFIEVFMDKIHETQCYFGSWDDTCKSIVRIYIDQRRQFSPSTICFLLRCYDLKLLKEAFENDLVDSLCFGNCQNWHIMFVASYQERFFSSSIENIFEGFMCRYILLSKLRCMLKQKRSFLTWFAGSLHLYADEYFLQSDEACFKNVLAKLFEGLILNGLLTNSEFKNFYQMLIKRNEEMLSVLNGSYINQQHSYNNHQTVSDDSNKKDELKQQCYFPNLNLLFPLTLKNICRLAVKRQMTKYTRTHVECLPLPNNLKKFIYFDNECDAAFRSSLTFCKKKLG